MTPRQPNAIYISGTFGDFTVIASHVKLFMMFIQIEKLHSFIVFKLSDTQINILIWI